MAVDDRSHALRIDVVDSHTEGEPTRTVIAGFPDLRGTTMAERRDDARARFDHLREALVCEPRGHDAVVAAILTPPVSDGAVAGVIFCDDAAFIGMCGHGTMGVVRTLAHLGRIPPAGTVRLDTPVGTVRATLHDDGGVSVENVPSICTARDVACDVPGLGLVCGDVAYGGNWFFLTELPLALEKENVRALLDATTAVRATLRARGVTGTGGADIDHVAAFGPARRADADARTFVLCPGVAYDRSPCGTGTSAKMASLHARGTLALGSPWRQESIIGSLFEGVLAQRDGALIPTIRGRAYVTAEATLLLDARDPYRYGLHAQRDATA